MKKSITIAMSFVGLIVGAGFASGQEMIQYFVSFGQIGFVGAIMASAIMIIAGIATLELGSYYLAGEHTAVFDRTFHPITSKFIDASIVFTLFAVGFVMFAGAGSNLQQQFGLPIWVGALLMMVLVLISGLLDVERLTEVIGTVTPFIIGFVVFAGVVSAMHMPSDLTPLNEASQQLTHPMSHWIISSLNYVGLSLITAVSMSIVIGGSHLDPKVAGRGGMIGGVLYTLLLLVATGALFINVETVGHADLPMLELVNSIHPWAGVAMALVIFAMIYNTAVGMFYALGKRLTRNHPKRFFPVYAVAVLVGFGLSFAGFKSLVSMVYPIVGYIGIFLAFLMAWYWFNGRKKINQEAQRREKMRELLARKLDPRRRFTRRHRQELHSMTEESHMDNKTLSEAVVDELDADESVNFSKDDAGSDLGKEFSSGERDIAARPSGSKQK